MEERIAEIKQRMEDTSRGYWKLVTDPKDVGKDWTVCYFGNSGEDNKDYCLYITTDSIRVSEYWGDAKADAVFIAHAKQDIDFLLQCIEDIQSKQQLQLFPQKEAVKDG